MRATIPASPLSPSASPQSLLSDLHIPSPSFNVPPSLHAISFEDPSTDSIEEPFATAVRTNGALNGELDLLPCTLDQYLKLSEYTPAKYELIDNHLFFKRHMDDPHAGLIRQSLSYKLRQLHANGRAHICVHEVGNVHLPGASFSLSPTNRLASSASSSVLVPDITITPYSPRQSPHRRSPRSAAFVASYTKQSPLMHIEITSQQSSRRTDFTTKWVKYAQAQVDEYVIIDRDKPHAPRQGSSASPLWRPCVVVGKRNGPGPFRTTGYPTSTVDGAPRRSSRIAAQSPSQPQAGYHWQIFEGDTPIDCTYFRELGLTPNSLFSIGRVEQLQAEDQSRSAIMLEREAAQRRAAEQRAQRNSEEKRAAEQRARRNSEEKRAAEHRARRNSEEKRAAEQRARRNSEERRAAEQRARRNSEERKTAESKAEKAESRAEKAERELQVMREKLAMALEHNSRRENRKRSRPSSISSDASEERTQIGRVQNDKPRCPKRGRKPKANRLKDRATNKENKS